MGVPRKGGGGSNPGGNYVIDQCIFDIMILLRKNIVNRNVECNLE